MFIYIKLINDPKPVNKTENFEIVFSAHASVSPHLAPRLLLWPYLILLAFTSCFILKTLGIVLYEICCVF